MTRIGPTSGRKNPALAQEKRISQRAEGRSRQEGGSQGREKKNAKNKKAERLVASERGKGVKKKG